MLATVIAAFREVPEAGLMTGDGLLGHLFYKLLGFTAQPTGAHVAIYLATIGAIVGPMRLVGRRGGDAHASWWTEALKRGAAPIQVYRRTWPSFAAMSWKR